MNLKTKTVLDALNRPSTLKALMRKTGYPVNHVLAALISARSEGYRVIAHYRKDEPTYYERIDKWPTSSLPA